LQPIPNSIIFHWRVNMLHKTNTSRIGSDSYMGFSPVRFKRTSHCIHAFQVLVSQGGSLLNHTPNSTKKWQLVPPESLAHVTQQIDLNRKHRPRYNLTHVLPRLKFNHRLMASHWIQCQLLLARGQTMRKRSTKTGQASNTQSPIQTGLQSCILLSTHAPVDPWADSVHVVHMSAGSKHHPLTSIKSIEVFIHISKRNYINSLQ
jgi:hypothetical protein